MTAEDDKITSGEWVQFVRIKNKDGVGDTLHIMTRIDGAEPCFKASTEADRRAMLATPKLIAALEQAERWIAAEVGGRLENETLAEVRAALASVRPY